ncbi:CRISPR-associated endonuclease Cas2 [Salinarchaeum sp. IM2453]|uniref:CRISPR-associated endonuclease Cas2 n=1 Tax=Salinarchaeum sp. IM2453 TaxID=2862870 RepID=UPI001C82F56C|nr:CRISPR-associated endonuclease Cas2 [Salinarchaeum sp. IM2453]QZA89528.1 CRISPR-associated endonuclease Cas2 [Salinarchaeum sp. IM2453]
MTSRYAIAYDVTEDRLRRQIRQACKRYGAHQQYSLFEVKLTPTERAKLVDKLECFVREAQEPAHIRIYSVGPRSNDIDIPEIDDSDEPANIV